jgi:hypothetical protein
VAACAVRIVTRRVIRERQPWSGRPPDGEIAEYARDHVDCRNCGARPGFPCPAAQARGQLACPERFADAAAEYVPLWKDARGRPKAS